jgi:hypothetical protein
LLRKANEENVSGKLFKIGAYINYKVSLLNPIFETLLTSGTWFSKRLEKRMLLSGMVGLYRLRERKVKCRKVK